MHVNLLKLFHELTPQKSDFRAHFLCLYVNFQKHIIFNTQMKNYKFNIIKPRQKNIVFIKYIIYYHN